MYHKIEDFSLLNPDEAHHHHQQQQQQQRLTLIPGSGRDGQGGLGDATARKRTAGQEEEDNARKKARAPEGRAAGACQGRAKEKRPKKRGLSNAGLTADEVMEDLDALLKLFRAAT